MSSGAKHNPTVSYEKRNDQFPGCASVQISKLIHNDVTLESLRINFGIQSVVVLIFAIQMYCDSAKRAGPLNAALVLKITSLI